MNIINQSLRFTSTVIRGFMILFSDIRDQRTGNLDPAKIMKAASVSFLSMQSLTILGFITYDQFIGLSDKTLKKLEYLAITAPFHALTAASIYFLSNEWIFFRWQGHRTALLNWIFDNLSQLNPMDLDSNNTLDRQL